MRPLAQDEEEETQAIGLRHVVHIWNATQPLRRNLLGTSGGGVTPLVMEEVPTRRINRM